MNATSVHVVRAELDHPATMSPALQREVLQLILSSLNRAGEEQGIPLRLFVDEPSRAATSVRGTPDDTTEPIRSQTRVCAINVRLTVDEHKATLALAKRHRITLSDAVRWLMRRGRAALDRTASAAAVLGGPGDPSDR